MLNSSAEGARIKPLAGRGAARKCRKRILQTFFTLAVRVATAKHLALKNAPRPLKIDIKFFSNIF